MTGEMWSRDELVALIPALEKKIREVEAGVDFQVKGVPPMTSEEAIDHLANLADTATERPWTGQEHFLHGQLLSVYRQAVQAEMMGKKGRYFVVSEADIQRMAGQL